MCKVATPNVALFNSSANIYWVLAMARYCGGCWEDKEHDHGKPCEILHVHQMRQTPKRGML